MNIKSVIWDFNGTLLQDVQMSIDAMNTVLERRSLPLIESHEAFRKVFGFPVKDYYERLGMDFTKEPYKKPADEWVELYTKDMYTAPLTEGALEALELLKQNGINQLILSASEKARLTKHLDILGIANYFDEILGTGDVYAKGKDDLAITLSKRADIFPAVLIGDTDHDFECARIIGCDAILFSKGFMSEERLLPLGCPVYDNLLTIAEKIIK